MKKIIGIMSVLMALTVAIGAHPVVFQSYPWGISPQDFKNRSIADKWTIGESYTKDGLFQIDLDSPFKIKATAFFEKNRLIAVVMALYSQNKADVREFMEVVYEMETKEHLGGEGNSSETQGANGSWVWKHQGTSAIMRWTSEAVVVTYRGFE